MKPGARTGLATLEKSASVLDLAQTGNQRRLSFFHFPMSTPDLLISRGVLQLPVSIHGHSAKYFYSLDDGLSFDAIGLPRQPERVRADIRLPKTTGTGL